MPRTTLPRGPSTSANIPNLIRIGVLTIAALTAWRGSEAARPRVYAIQGAHVVVAPGQVIEKGTILVRDGIITAVGAEGSAQVALPADAEIVEGKELTVYAGLIDPFTHLGVPKGKEEAAGGEGRGSDRPKAKERPVERGPGRENLQIRSDAKGALLFQTPPAAELDRLHGMGFTSVLVVPDGGAFRGTSALVQLAGDDQAKMVIAPDVAAHMAFETAPDDVYPSSLMGVIALMRQSFEDARRQKTWETRWSKDPQGLARPPESPTLDAIAKILDGRRTMFEANDPRAFTRVGAIAAEFGFKPIVVGSGYEYEILDEVRRSGYPLIAPVAFPEPLHVDDDDANLEIRMKDLRRFDLAPAGPAALEHAGIPFAFTTFRLKNVGDFTKNVRAAIERGLSKDAALAAVTTVPAKLLGVDAILGTIEKGKIANLIMTDGDLFAEKTKVRKLFIDGNPIETEKESKDFDPNAKVDPRGAWEVTYTFRGETTKRTWTIDGEPDRLSGTAETQQGKSPMASLAMTGNKLTGTYTTSSGTIEFTWIIKGEQASGTSILPGGQKVTYSAKRVPKTEGGAR